MNNITPAHYAETFSAAAERAAYEELRASVAGDVDALTLDELREDLDHAYEHMSESKAEYGMGAVSMGFDPYEVAPLEMPRTELFIKLAEERLAAECPPPATPTTPAIDTSDDLPF